MNFITHNELVQNNDKAAHSIRKKQTLDIENGFFHQNYTKNQRLEQKQGIDSFLKYGDIITLRVEVLDKFEGIIQGDGITLNKLEVVNINNQQNLKQEVKPSEDFSYFKIKECLFQIHPSKQYSLKNSIPKVNTQNQEKINNPQLIKHDIRTKKIYPDNTKENNNFTNEEQIISNNTQSQTDEAEINILNQLDSIVTFESEIQLIHLYSGSTIKINKDSLAIKTACKEVILNVEDDFNSNFQIMSQGNVRKKGEPVFYGEKINIATKLTPWYYLNIHQIQDDNIELIGSLNSYPFKFHKYLDYKSYLTTLQENNIQDSDIISIKNLSNNSYLCCKKLEFLGNQGKNQPEEILNSQLTNIQNQYQITLDKVQDQDNEIASFWQIEYINESAYSKFTSQTKFTLKHALTGLYLSVIENSQNSLSLGLQISKSNQSCTFRFVNQNCSNATINHTDLLSIIHEKEVKKDQKVNFILQSFGNVSLKLEQADSIIGCGNSFFMLEIKELPDQYSVSTLNSILFKSYDILTELKQNQNQPLKNIDNQIHKINQVIYQTANFLEQKRYFWQDREKKQISLVQTNIYSLIIQILMNLQFQIPQTIGQKNERLVKCNQNIFSLIMEIVLNNTFLCDQILDKGIQNNSEFFSLFDLFNDCDDMHHIVQHIILLSNKIPKKVIKRLIDRLNKITEQNIGSQINIIKLLSLIMTDYFENPRVDCQTIILNSIFKEQKMTLQFLKFFFKFELQENSCYFEFFPDFFQDQQIEKNQKFFDQLKMFNSENDIKNQGRLISLQFLISLRNKQLEQYLEFFVEVLLFYSNLCKGRNYRAIEIIQKLCNIQEEQIFQLIKVLFQEEISNSKGHIFSALFQLYVTMFLNIDPLVASTRLINQDCYYISDGKETVNIHQFKLSENEEQPYINKEIQNSDASTVLFSQRKLTQQKEKQNKISLQLLPIIDSLKKLPPQYHPENPHTYVNVLHSLQILGLISLNFDQLEILLDIFSSILDSDRFGRMPSQFTKVDLYKNQKINFKSVQQLNKILDIFVVFMMEVSFTNLLDQIMLSYLVYLKKHPYCYLVIKNFYIMNYQCSPKNLRNQISFEQADAWNEGILFFNGENEQLNLSLDAIRNEIPYAIKYVHKNKIRKEKFESAFKNVNQFIIKTIEQLLQQNLGNNNQFQNAFLRMGGFKIFNLILINNDEITQNQEISEFYTNLLTFYFYLVKNHSENSLQIQNINQIINIVSYIEINLSSNLTPKQTRISKLLKNLKLPAHCQLQLIKYLFLKMEIYGVQILSQDQFFIQIAKDEQLELSQTKNVKVEKKIEFSISAFIECLKILIVLVESFELNQNFYIERQELILSLILRDKLLLIALQPEYYFNCDANGNFEFIYENQNFFRIKLHKNLIMLISSCCKSNVIASEEFLRMLSIKKVQTLYSTTTTPYKLKSAYLNYIFVLQFKGQIKEDLRDEICDFLKIFQIEFNKFAENLEQGLQIEEFFEKKQLFNFEQKTNLIAFPLKNILDNNREYWKYYKNGVTKIFFEFLILHQSREVIQCTNSLTKIIELLRSQSQLHFANNMKQQQKVDKFLQQLIFLEKKTKRQWISLNHFTITEKKFNFLYKQQLFQSKINYGDFKKKFLEFYLSTTNTFMQTEINKGEEDLFDEERLKTRDEVESQSTQECVVIDHELTLYQLERLQEILKTNHNSFWEYQNNRMLHYKINLPALELFKFPFKVFLNMRTSDLESLNLAFSYFNNQKIDCCNFQQEFELLLSCNLQNKRQLLTILQSVFQNYFQFNENYKVNQQLFWQNSSKFIQKLCRNNINFQNLLGLDQFQYDGNSILDLYLEKFCNLFETGIECSDQIFCGFNTILSLVSRCELNSLKTCQNKRFMLLLDMKKSEIEYENVIEKLIFSLVNLSNGQKNALIIENFIEISRINFNYSILNYQILLKTKNILLTLNYFFHEYMEFPIKNSQLMFQQNEYMEFRGQSYYNYQQYRKLLNLQQVQNIEIFNENSEFEIQFFEKWKASDYFSLTIKNHLLYNPQQQNDYSRNLGLIQNFQIYKEQMSFQYYLSSFKIMKFFMKVWRFCSYGSYFLFFLVVIIFISDSQEKEMIHDEKGIANYQYFFNIINSIVLFLNVFSLIFCSIEKTKIICYEFKNTIQNIRKKIQLYLIIQDIQYFDNFIFSANQIIGETDIGLIFFSFLFDFETIYNVLKIVLIIYGYYNPYIYGILLLDIIYLSDNLQIIIKSITLNGLNLLKFTYLAIVGLLIYSFIAYLYFKPLFEIENGIYANTFTQAITTTINFGLRSGGGIGDALKTYSDPEEDSQNYWSRYLFDISFFIIFNMLFFQMLFGQIIDTFGQLRAQKKQIQQDIQEKCFICGMTKDELSSISSTHLTQEWHSHINDWHNVYNMLFYLIYVSEKPQDELNSLEMFILNCLKNRDLSFLPIRNQDRRNCFQMSPLKETNDIKN